MHTGRKAFLAAISALFAALVVLLTVFTGGAVTGAAPTRAVSPQYDVPTVVPGEWPMYGHDVSRTNFNPDETTINASNVGQLISRWQMSLGSARTSTASSSGPSVAGGK